MKVKFPTKSI